MKLVTVYQVATDEKFLVELLDDDLTLEALWNVVQERVSFAPAFHRLVFKNSYLKGGYLPIACLRESKDCVHIVPTELNPSAYFSVFVKIRGDSPGYRIEVHSLRYSTTLEEFKTKLFALSKLRPSRTTIYRDGKPLLNDQCMMLYYGIFKGAQLEAMEYQPVSEGKKLRIFVRPARGRTQVHWVDTTEPIRVLKEKMYQWTGIPIRHQKLVFEGRPLEDHKTLSDYRVYRECIIGVLRVRDEETPNRPRRDRVMNALEYDHYGYLFGKTVRGFRAEDEPPAEIIEYLFERWRDHMVHCRDISRDDIRKYQLDVHSFQLFLELRVHLLKWNHAREMRMKFVAVLWVAQEILKFLVPNPSWNRIIDRSALQELRWDDEKRLTYETTENNKLFVSEAPERKPSIRRYNSMKSVSTRSSGALSKSLSDIPDENESMDHKVSRRSWGFRKEGRKKWGLWFEKGPNSEKQRDGPKHRILKIGLGCLGGMWCLIGC